MRLDVFFSLSQIYYFLTTRKRLQFSVEIYSFFCLPSFSAIFFSSREREREFHTLFRLIFPSPLSYLFVRCGKRAVGVCIQDKLFIFPLFFFLFFFSLFTPVVVSFACGVCAYLFLSFFYFFYFSHRHGARFLLLLSSHQVCTFFLSLFSLFYIRKKKSMRKYSLVRSFTS